MPMWLGASLSDNAGFGCIALCDPRAPANVTDCIKEVSVQCRGWPSTNTYWTTGRFGRIAVYGPCAPANVTDFIKEVSMQADLVWHHASHVPLCLMLATSLDPPSAVPCALAKRRGDPQICFSYPLSPTPQANGLDKFKIQYTMCSCCHHLRWICSLGP